MSATAFECRHQLLLHELIVGGALLTYLVDADDVIWRFIKTSGTDVRLRERSLFAVATILLGVSAWLCTWARAHSQLEWAEQAIRLDPVAPRFPALRLRYRGELLYAIALASLVPLSGACMLIAGEAIRLYRLERGAVASEDTASRSLLDSAAVALKPGRSWAAGFRREAVKWGLFLTMIVFTLTLRDRVAEVLIAATVLTWGLLNLRFRPNSRKAVPL